MSCDCNDCNVNQEMHDMPDMPEMPDGGMPITPHVLIENAIALSADKVFIVHLIINSPGGDLNAAWMICDIMDTIESPVITYGFGLIGSAAFIIYMNGDYGLRFATKNTQFMSHTFTMVIGGKRGDHIAHASEITRMHKRMIDHYMKCTGLTKAEIEDKLLVEHDIWLTAANAKALRIVDKIIPVRKNHYSDVKKAEEKAKAKAEKENNKCKTTKKRATRKSPKSTTTT
jgi:ATP-dependent protease ClpP protease subunit